MTTHTNDFNGYMSQLETTLDEYLVKKSPALPPNVKEAIVRFGPWITLIVLILAIPGLLFLLGVGSIMAPIGMMAGVHFGINSFVSIILMIIALVLEAMAIPLLMKRQMKGWRLVFYAGLINFVSSIVNFDIVGAIIGGLISMYILFQVKSYYK